MSRMPKMPKMSRMFLYIDKIMKQIDSNITLSTDAKKYLQNILIECIEQFAKYSSDIMNNSRTKTLSSRDIQTATRIFFVGELAKHAVFYGTKAVTKFTSFIPKKNKKVNNAQKSGLIFSPSYIRSILENKLIDYKIDSRISKTAPIYLASVLEYLTIEILDLVSPTSKKIDSKDIKAVLKEDDEINRTLCRLLIK